MVKQGVLLFTVLSAMLGCAPSHVNYERIHGPWLFELTIGGQTLPFHVRIEDDSTLTVFSVNNGAEHIRAEKLTMRGDSLFVQLPVFNTSIEAHLLSDSVLTGEFVDHSRQGDYRIPLHGQKGLLQRFNDQIPARDDISGRWAVGFSPGTVNAYPAIGEFHQEGNDLTGTFLTTTGDFRFLEGSVSGDSMFLSSFDGAHALLFKARVSGDSISGQFWSGIHWQEPWKGVRDKDVHLPDPEFLTSLRPGYSKMEFSFPDLQGQLVSLTDARFVGKVVIVQLMGSWCPNCLDETRYLMDIHSRLGHKGLEIVALGFERGRDDDERMANLRRLKDHLPLPYTVLLAGSASKDDAAEKLPMLSHVLAFPTTVFIDRRGRVRRIHTGFSGPGTGEHYHAFVLRTEALIGELLEEKPVF
ncbi:MAG: TlpA family protein disulfide reductase [Flavobacteriales bacterium]|nr:TlpA family protein disulfide reductase [Flavobacteriales bacterium]